MMNDPLALDRQRIDLERLQRTAGRPTVRYLRPRRRRQRHVS